LETKSLSDTILSASAYFSGSKPHPVRGYLYIAASTIFWGLSATMGRAVFTGRITIAGHVVPKIDPLTMAQGRTTIALLVLVPLLLLRNRAALRVQRAHLVQFFPLGVLGLAASNYFYYLAIERTSVATAIVLQYVAPVWVLLYMIVRKLQRPTAQRVLGVGLAVMGCALAVGLFTGRSSFPWLGLSGAHFSTVGVVAAELAAISFAFYNVYGQHLLQRYERWTVLVYALFWSALFWIVVNPPWKIAAQHYTGGQWAFLAVFAMTSMLVPFSLYFSGLQHLDPTRAVVTSCLEPVFAILLTALLLGEGVSSIQVLGMLIVLAATVLVQRPDRAHHEPIITVEPIE
jgi:drug/metabolite transporter (DMT)-like permease